MTCQEFLERYSEYRDDRLTVASRSEADGHLRSCPRCAEYHRVLTAGVHHLRDLPDIEVASDFEDRLRHRIYHLDQMEVADPRSSRTVGMAVAGLALLLAGVAWIPQAAPTPEVQIAPIVVRQPAARPGSDVVGRPNGFLGAPALRSPASEGRLMPWDAPRPTLYDYSPLSVRDRASIRRTGLD